MSVWVCELCCACNLLVFALVIVTEGAFSSPTAFSFAATTQHSLVDSVFCFILSTPFMVFFGQKPICFVFDTNMRQHTTMHMVNGYGSSVCAEREKHTWYGDNNVPATMTRNYLRIENARGSSNIYCILCCAAVWWWCWTSDELNRVYASAIHQVRPVVEWWLIN